VDEDQPVCTGCAAAGSNRNRTRADKAATRSTAVSNCRIHCARNGENSTASCYSLNRDQCIFGATGSTGTHARTSRAHACHSGTSGSGSAVERAPVSHTRNVHTFPRAWFTYGVKGETHCADSRLNHFADSANCPPINGTGVTEFTASAATGSASSAFTTEHLPRIVCHFD